MEAAWGVPEKLMINIMPIFINFLAVDSLRLDNDRIEKFCLEKRKNSSGRVISNGGGWQSDNLDIATPELSELFGEVRKGLTKYTAPSSSIHPCAR